ncbi:MAG: BamA/TamA family outer membrane protein [Luteitalea sp.]|nr:BamA/TamA family outer membrane protein [Luteitalea sp.]
MEHETVIIGVNLESLCGTVVRVARVSAVALAWLAWPSATLAQSSRADALAMMQAKKAEQLRPYENSTGEQILDTAEELVLATSSVYPWIGSIYPGAWLGLGGGYQRSVADTGRFNARGAWSARNYKLLQADLDLPELVRHRLAMTARVQWLDAPSVAFYGIGNESDPDQETTYTYTPTTLAVTGRLQIMEWLALGGGAEYLDVRSDAGRLDASLDPPPVTAAGFGEDVSYGVGRIFLDVDWRDEPGYSQRGGQYRVEWASYGDRDTGMFSFRQTEAEIVQLLPLMRANWVLGFRGLVTTTEVGDAETVPVFMLPALGGSSSLRGYPSWRFRDRHRLLLSGEYRWTPGQLVDMAIFVDAGKVVARHRDLDLQGLKKNYGIGLRVHGPSFTALRLDLARSREGWVLNIGGGTAF